MMLAKYIQNPVLFFSTWNYVDLAWLFKLAVSHSAHMYFEAAKHFFSHYLCWVSANIQK